MVKRIYTIRVEDCDLKAWQSCAEKFGLTLSEWIRRRCNGEGWPVKHDGVVRVIRTPAETRPGEQGGIIRGDTAVEAPRGRHRSGARSRHSAAVKRDSDSGAKVSSADNLHSTEHSPAEPRVSAETTCPDRIAGVAPKQDAARFLNSTPCCSHRKVAGEVCYKCDPKFGYPVIG
jgi:hypothetical protein